MISTGTGPIGRFMDTAAGRFLDYVPIASSAINLAGLVERAMYKGEGKKPTKLGGTVFSRIREKISLDRGRALRNMVLLIPFIGNIIVGGYDAVRATIATMAEKREVNELKDKAKEGDPDAQDKLAQRYEKGIGVKKDLKEATRLYSLADFQRIYDLGLSFQSGAGDKRNLEKAAYYYKIAARGGIVEAFNNLGWALENGDKYLQANAGAAVEYYRKAADKSPLAKCNLARCYEEGLGGYEKDQSMANKLYDEAATVKGNALKRAAYYELLAEEYKNGESVEQDLEKAKLYYEKAKALKPLREPLGIVQK